MVEFISEENRFRAVERKELDEGDMAIRYSDERLYYELIFNDREIGYDYFGS